MKQTTKTFIVVVVFVIIAVSFLIYRSNKPVVVYPVNTGGSYTLAEIAKHKDATSCWTTISGKVYDLTSWIGAHPGGAETILGICGIDGTAAFDGQHGGQRRPASELAGFEIGSLSNK